MGGNTCRQVRPAVEPQRPAPPAGISPPSQMPRERNTARTGHSRATLAFSRGISVAGPKEGSARLCVPAWKHRCYAGALESSIPAPAVRGDVYRADNAKHMPVRMRHPCAPAGNAEELDNEDMEFRAEE